ncbi:hypothetical protein I4U23_026523 [Adineta vaga]|nr:hypothetical protein I4U23_026523 [Adineta vaga]
MNSFRLSIMINDIDMKFIAQLNKRFELVLLHIQSLNDNTISTNDLLNKVRHDLIERYELRNNYYHRQFPIRLHNLSSIKSRKKCYQLIEKQHDHSKQFYKKVFNIQFFSNIDQYQQQYHQSNQILHELQTTIHHYENEIDYLKQEILKQTNQIYQSSNEVFQIQFDQHLVQSNIRQLKQQIQFEKQFYCEQNPFLIEYHQLLIEISQINNDIQETSQRIVSLQQNQTEPLQLTITNTSEEINHHTQQHLPIDLNSNNKIASMKCEVKKSKSICVMFFNN